MVIRRRTSVASRAQTAVKRINSVVVVVASSTLSGGGHSQIRAVVTNAASCALVDVCEACIRGVGTLGAWVLS